MELPHKLDRKYQLQTALRILQSQAKYVIVSAPTGSGKSAYVAYAASQGYKTLVVVRTKSLQRQYADGYGLTSITGKGDYECLGYGQLNDEIGMPEEKRELYEKVLELVRKGATRGEKQAAEAAQKRLLDKYGQDLSLMADICDRPEFALEQCRFTCPYYIDRSCFVDSISGVTNYAKFLRDRRLVEDFNPNIIFLDEAHELSDNIVTDFSGTTFSWKSKLLKKYIPPVIIDTPQPIALRQGREWLETLYWSLRGKEPRHPFRGGDRILYQWHKRQLEKVDITLACMDIEPHCWFIKADEYGFTCKPLTSQFHFLRLFEKAPKIVLMSATIQKQDIAALGITDYEFIKVPNVIPSIMRPVYDLQAPAYKNGMSYQDKKEHAEIISKVFKEHPGWNGIIHTTSEKMAIELADMIKNGNPIWIPTKGKATDKSYAEWQAFNNHNEAAICISWQFFAGVDMGDVAINITARTPYPYFGDEYEKTRFGYHPGQARVRVANSLEQQMGRTRRGFDDHYGPMARKFNGIADGKWTKLKSAMQKDFLESVII